jgi:small-conductance mechanosensitive channel
MDVALPAQIVTAWTRALPWLQRPEVQTVIVLVAFGGGRLVASWRIRRMDFPTVEDRRRWLVAARNLAVVVLTAALIVVWNEAVQTLLLSIVAIAAALVLATKEFLLCISGAIWRTASRAFDVGDRIEVNGFRGDVIDHGLLATTLLEVGPGEHTNQASGRAIVLPNSVFLTYPMVNETFTDSYVLHPFELAVPRASDWKKAERVLLEASNAECAVFLDDAKASLGRQISRYALPNLGLDPRVSIELTDPTQIRLLVRVPVPVRQKSKIEQAILRRFLDGTREEAPALAAARG